MENNNLFLSLIQKIKIHLLRPTLLLIRFSISLLIRTPSLRHTLSTCVRLAQPGLEIFSRSSKAMKSNLSWRDLLRSYDFLIVRIFSFKRLYPSLLKIYASESQANPCLHEEVIKILTPSYLAYSGWPNPTLNTIVLNKTKLEFSV